MAAILDGPALQAWWSVLCYLSKGTFFDGLLVRSLLITFQIPSVTFKPLGLVVPVLPCIQLLPVCSPATTFSILSYLLTSLSLQNTAHCPCILLHTSDLAQAPFTGFLQVNLLITLQSLWPPTVCAPVRAQMVLITCCWRLSIILRQVEWLSFGDR